MSNSWLRLWHDMPTDPKFRTIAKKAGRPLSEVISTFLLMLTNASANAEDRGRLLNWSDEDAAAALDAEPEHIAAIRAAMQGKTLDGDMLSGWEKRQPKREDSSAERTAEWRRRRKTRGDTVTEHVTQSDASERTVTQRDAPDKDTDTEGEKEKERITAPQQIPESDAAREVPLLPPQGAAAAPRVDLRELSERITSACNGALASQAIAPGLASMSTPLMWIEQGADLERDVLPTLIAAGRKHHGRGIRSWDYFTPMVAEAKARRSRGLPEASGWRPSYRPQAEERPHRVAPDAPRNLRPIEEDLSWLYAPDGSLREEGPSC